MKILIIDRDQLTTQLLQSRLQNEGHEVVSEPIRKQALELLAANHSFDVIMIDPAPLPSVRQVTLPLRWEQREHYFYILQLSHSPEPDEVTQAGLNDVIAKPFDWQDVAEKMTNAERLVTLMKYLSTTPEIHSDGTIFGKRAFYQLVLSALDRAYRYDEKGFLMLIQISNVDKLREKLGSEGLKPLQEKMEAFLSTLHRRSDYLGHIDKASYALLIMRPAISSEPLDAVDRIGLALREFQNTLTADEHMDFLIQLWALPSASVMREYRIEG
jgi:PleD family two-component response regulator